MLSINTLSIIFPYLELWEVTERLCMVCKSFAKAAKLSYKSLKSLRINYNFLETIHTLSPFIDELTLNLVGVCEIQGLIPYLDDFPNLKCLELILPNDCKIKFPLRHTISVHVLVRLEKIILTGKNIYKRLTYLPSLATDEVKIRCVLIGILRESDKAAGYSESSFKAKIQINELENDPKIQLLFVGQTNLFKLSKTLYNTTIPIGVKFLEISSKNESFKFENLYSNVNKLENLSVLKLDMLPNNEISEWVKNETNQMITEIYITVEVKANNIKSLNEFCSYIKGKPLLEKLWVWVEGAEFNYAEMWAIELMSICLTLKNFQMLNGIFIKKWARKEYREVVLDATKSPTENMVTYALFNFYYKELLKVPYYVIKLTETKTRTYTWQALSKSFNQETVEKNPVFNYITQGKQQGLTRIQLFNFYIQTCRQFFSPDLSETNNNIFFQEIKSFKKVIKSTKFIKSQIIDYLKSQNINIDESPLCEILCLTYIPSIKSIAVGCANGMIKFYSTETYNFIKLIQAHKNRVECMACNNQILASYSKQGEIKVRYIETLEEKIEYLTEGSVLSCIKVMDDNTIMSGSYEGIIKIWMDNPVNLEHSQYVKDFDFNNKYIVSGSSDCNVYFWDAENYSLLSCNSGHKGHIHKVKIFNNHQAITAGYDKLLLIWDLESRTIIREFTVSSHAIKALAIKNNIIAVGTSAEIKLLDFTGKILEENTKTVEVIDMSFTDGEILAYIVDVRILNFRLPNGSVLENRNPETFTPNKCSPAIKFCLGFFR